MVGFNESGGSTRCHSDRRLDLSLGFPTALFIPPTSAFKNTHLYSTHMHRARQAASLKTMLLLECLIGFQSDKSNAPTRLFHVPVNRHRTSSFLINTETTARGRRRSFEELLQRSECCPSRRTSRVGQRPTRFQPTRGTTKPST